MNNIFKVKQGLSRNTENGWRVVNTVTGEYVTGSHDKKICDKVARLQRARELTLFEIVWTIDCARDISLALNIPHVIRKAARRGDLVCTEYDDQWDYNYMAEDDKESDWYNGKHRKFYGTVNKYELKQIIEDCCLSYDCQGSILGYNGCMPSFNFSSGSSYNVYMVSLCATPIPTVEMRDIEDDNYRNEYAELVWKRYEKALKAMTW